MLKKIVCLALAAVLAAFACACGSDGDKANQDGTQSVASAASDSATASDNATSDAEPQADATLTVTVKKGDITKFKSDRPYDSSKKDISLILVTGQSNFTTSVGYSCEYNGLISGTTTTVPEIPTLPDPGMAYSSYSGNTITVLSPDRDMNKLCDAANETRTLGGVTPSFAVRWHEITGTTVVFVQCAVGAVGVHEWTPDPENYICDCAQNGGGKLYSNAVSAFLGSYNALSKDYNIVYTGYIWNQGEHDEGYGLHEGNTVTTDEAYYAAYKSMHEGFMQELDLDFGGISVVRANQAGSTAAGSRTLTIARAAQYKLCNDIDNLFMLSTVSETCDHSMMDQTNTIHYAQKTFNVMGADCADNLASYLGIASNPAEFTGIDVYTKDGILVCKFDKDGNAVIDEEQRLNNVLPKSYLSKQMLVRLETLGTGYTLGEFKFVTDDNKDLSDYVNDFCAFDWDPISGEKVIKKVKINCVIE